PARTIIVVASGWRCKGGRAGREDPMLRSGTKRRPAAPSPAGSARVNRRPEAVRLSPEQDARVRVVVPPTTVAVRSAARALMLVVRLEERLRASLTSTAPSAEQDIPPVAPPPFDAGATNGAARYLHGRLSSESRTSGRARAGRLTSGRCGIKRDPMAPPAMTRRTFLMQVGLVAGGPASALRPAAID